MGENQAGGEGRGEFVITPGGPRPPEMVQSVGPGQAVYQDQQGGYIVEKTVLTPGGPRPASFVHHITPGFGLHLDQSVIKKVELATQRLTDFPASPAIIVPFGAHGPAGIPRSPPEPGVAPGAAVPAFPDGWQAYAWWDSGSTTSITSFTTTWAVPAAPSTNSGQTVFLFNGIQNTGPNFGIFQPVLQWGTSAAGGGAYWSVASWYVAQGGQAFHTNLVQVNAGAVLVGVMTQTGSAGGKYSYSSTFQNISGTTLPIQNIAPLHWANETLECYGLTQSSDLPATLDTAFTGINLLTGATHPKLSWTAVNQFTDLGQHAVVASNANPAGEIDVWYRRVHGPFNSMATLPNGKIYVTIGSQYLRYSDSSANTVDAGYPLPIAGHWGNLPAAFAAGFDSMASLPNGKTYVTKGNQYIRYSDPSASTIDSGYPKPIAGNWGNLPAAFVAGFDSMATLPNGKTYVTKGDQYVRYSDPNASTIDPGYPKPIAGNWGNLPAAFVTGFDSMATLPNGKTYVTKGDQYVRYSDPNANTIDPGYPKSITGNWG